MVIKRKHAKVGSCQLAVGSRSQFIIIDNPKISRSCYNKFKKTIDQTANCPLATANCFDLLFPEKKRLRFSAINFWVLVLFSFL
jgi:hypothetical protein